MGLIEMWDFNKISVGEISAFIVHVTDPLKGRKYENCILASAKVLVFQTFQYKNPSSLMSKTAENLMSEYGVNMKYEEQII